MRCNSGARLILMKLGLGALGSVHFFQPKKPRKSLLLCSAEMGDALAQGLLAFMANNYNLALTAAMNNDSIGLCELGCMYGANEGDVVIARDLLERSADLGNGNAIYFLAHSLFAEQPAKALEIMCEILPFDWTVDFCRHLENVVSQYASEPYFGGALMLAGETLKKMFDSESEFIARLTPKVLPLRVVRWCVAASGVARTACVCWILCAKQMELHKDMRQLIAKFVWESRKRTHLII